MQTNGLSKPAERNARALYVRFFMYTSIHGERLNYGHLGGPPVFQQLALMRRRINAN
jgi:hypothetical protein